MPSVLTFNTPASPLTPVQSGTSYTAPFTVSATFQPDTPGGSCAALSYRQSVSGTIKVDNVAMPFYLCAATGTLLDPTTPREDGCPPSGSNCTGCTAYGYRQCNMTNDRYWNPDQATGADFQMTDAPGFSNVEPGHTYELDVTFVGDINGASPASTATWTVTGSLTTSPSTATPTVTMSCNHDETPLGLHEAQDDKGRKHVIVAIARRPGAPALHPSAIQLDLTDKAGQVIRLGPPNVHEVSNARRAIAYVVYPLQEDAQPEKGSIALDGEPWGELPVV